MAALVSVACSNDEHSDGVCDSMEIRLTSGIEVQTRSNTQATQIVSGETVRAWVEDTETGKALYRAQELTSDGNGALIGASMYFPQTGNGVDIYAMHGNFGTTFTQGTTVLPAEGVAFSVAADQSGMGTAYTNSDLLYAVRRNVSRTWANVDLDFYHMLSKIEVAIVSGKGTPELKEGPDAVTLGTTENPVILRGLFRPSRAGEMSDQSVRASMLMVAADGEGKTGVMNLSSRTSENFDSGSADYNEAIIVPQDMANKELIFRLKDGRTLSYFIPAFKETDRAFFESGKKYIYHVTMNLTELSITCRVKDWIVSEPIAGEALM